MGFLDNTDLSKIKTEARERKSTPKSERSPDSKTKLQKYAEGYERGGVSVEDLDEARAEATKLANALLQQKKEQDRLLADKARLEEDLEKNRQLIEDMKQVESKGGGIKEVLLDEIEPHPHNSNIYKSRLDEEFEKSIATNGILDPIVVCLGKDRLYRSLSGHRRLEAARKESVRAMFCNIHGTELGLIPIIDLGEIDEDEQLLRLVEYNRQREKTWSDKMMEAEILRETLAKGARIRKVSGLKNASIVDPVILPDRGDTRDKIGKDILGVSGKTVDAHFSILKDFKEAFGDAWRNNPLIQRVDAGELKPTKARTLLIEGKPEKKESRFAKVSESAIEMFINKYGVKFPNPEEIDDLGVLAAYDKIVHTISKRIIKAKTLISRQ